MVYIRLLLNIEAVTLSNWWASSFWWCGNPSISCLVEPCGQQVFVDVILKPLLHWINNLSSLVGHSIIAYAGSRYKFQYASWYSHLCIQKIVQVLTCLSFSLYLTIMHTDSWPPSNETDQLLVVLYDFFSPPPGAPYLVRSLKSSVKICGIKLLFLWKKCSRIVVWRWMKYMQWSW